MYIVVSRTICNICSKCKTNTLTPIKTLEVFLSHGFSEEKLAQDLSGFVDVDFVVRTKDLKDKFSNFCLVLPRRGWNTPWSSNAIEILQDSHIDNVDFIEKGYLHIFENQEDIKEIKNNIDKYEYLYDSMTQEVVFDAISSDLESWFIEGERKQDDELNILEKGVEYFSQLNKKMGLGLSQGEQEEIFNYCHKNNHKLTLAELMMFSQVNSEHCRHKIFNAKWHIENKEKEFSLFDFIKKTYKKNPNNVISAYADNSSVMDGFEVDYFVGKNQKYSYNKQYVDLLLKVETHNHPTAISPYAGAATGVGGEIRDEVATGIGGKSVAGLSGYSVSNLNIPNLKQDWEFDIPYPHHVSSALRIMIEAPLGASRFNNEFGRANLVGYFRSFAFENKEDTYCYHKPIMLAGGMGQVNKQNSFKKKVLKGDLVVILGGAGMLVGLGGGSISSNDATDSDTNLDFASVQRANPEMQRRAQEVINKCTQLNDENPIVFMHDVGAGGISNALPELLKDTGSGCVFDLDSIHVDDKTMSAMETWCNESQERYVLAVSKSKFELFSEFCKQESCHFSKVGIIDDSSHLTLESKKDNKKYVDLPIESLFGSFTPLEKNIATNIKTKEFPNLIVTKDLPTISSQILLHPSVASKSFLINIADRSIGGLSVREQMIGLKQVPVSDVAITTIDFKGLKGQAISVGERAPLAILNPEAAARVSLAESITNLASVNFELKDLMLSANWMAACGEDYQDIMLRKAVESLSDFCCDLGVVIPVGKDSLSMRTMWEENGKKIDAKSSVSLVVTAMSKINDVSENATPELVFDENKELFLIDLSENNQRMGGSIFASINKQIGKTTPDINVNTLKRFVTLMQLLHKKKMLYAYHDKSDGGIFATLCEMAFCSDCGLDINLDLICNKNSSDTINSSLFNEECGAVVQIDKKDIAEVISFAKEIGLENSIFKIGTVKEEKSLSFSYGNDVVLTNTVGFWHKKWHKNSFEICKLRDDTASAISEMDSIVAGKNILVEKTTFALPNIAIENKNKPRVAVLREIGTNGQREMAQAFMHAGFDTVNVSMQDLSSGKTDLKEFSGLAVSGGFSYGDVFGAGRGWAGKILHNTKLFDMFSSFFSRKDTFSFGVCNGCQMLSLLKSIIPGAEHFSPLLQNLSQQYESRMAVVKINKTNSVAFADMEGSSMILPVAHGEGRFDTNVDTKYITSQYSLSNGKLAEKYPSNPNGSRNSIASLMSDDGRVNILMPHPERIIRTLQETWRHPSDIRSKIQDSRLDSNWMKVFYNMHNWATNV